MDFNSISRIGITKSLARIRQQPIMVVHESTIDMMWLPTNNDKGPIFGQATKIDICNHLILLFDKRLV